MGENWSKKHPKTPSATHIRVAIHPGIDSICSFTSVVGGEIMATKRLKPSGKWEFVVKRKSLLPKPIYLLFDTEIEGNTYVEHLEKLLDQGIVPESCLVWA
jgi:hypothetical protein